MTNAIISQATKRNWDRLGVSESNAKLTKRANKTNSKKRILPLEYLYDLNNLSAIELILDEITACNNKIIDVMYSIELIAKPPTLPKTRASDAHFSGIVTLARNAIRRFFKWLGPSAFCHTPRPKPF
ncbi:MAG: hypothetical protein LBQ86_00410 [Holophagales bacterium]|nr:hypothetical protein [Holophagales bacterium]